MYFFMKKIIYLLILVLLSGCYKDADFFVPDSVEPEQFVKSGFSGMVTDEMGIPVSGATINIGSQRSETDINGVYFLENVTVNIKNAFVTVRKPDFYESSRTLTAKVNSQINLNFILTRKQEIGTFAVTAGETFSLPDGAVLEFPADGVAGFTGTASVFANTYDLMANNLSLSMPGDFIGEDEDGMEKSLIPYGMLVVGSSDDAGNPLNMAAGKTFEVRIPVPDINAPATVALFMFDQIEGIWQQKGTATLEGQFYVAQVNEFGHWAIAEVADSVNISGTVSKDNEPAGDVLMALRNVNTGITRFIYTNSRGAYNFKTSANATVKVGVYSLLCDEFIELKDINVAEVDITDQDFTEGTGITVYSGQARDCNQEPLTNGYAIVDDQLIIKLDEAGFFQGTVSNACLSALNFRTFDIRNQEMALTASPENISPVRVYQIACEELNEFTNFNYNNRSLLLSTETVANLEPAGSTEDGTLSVADPDIGILTFKFKGNSAGTYGVNRLELNDELNSTNFEIEEVNVEIILNETVEAGETLTGSFMGDFTDNDGATHSLSGNFRVIKDN